MFNYKNVFLKTNIVLSAVKAVKRHLHGVAMRETYTNTIYIIIIIISVNNDKKNQ